jgi:hypothetical protein
MKLTRQHLLYLNWIAKGGSFNDDWSPTRRDLVKLGLLRRVRREKVVTKRWMESELTEEGAKVIAMVALGIEP